MSRKLFIALVLVSVVLALPVLALAAGNPATAPVTVQLAALNNSNETGTAVLTDLGNGKTQVVVQVSNEPAGATQPMHIHSGQCGPTLGGVVYPLTNLVNGASTTTVNATLAALQTGQFAINGHKSAAEIQTYVFCGNIPAAAAAASTTTATTAAATTAATTAPTTAAAAPAATATSTAPTTAPTTGGDASNFILPALALGILALGAGLFMRRAMSR